jgi:molecular chaperone GrpE
MSTDVPLDENQPQPAVVAETVELQEKLAKAEQQREELLRTLAEYENARKRSARDLETERRFAHARLAADLLPAIDNLHRAMDVARNASESSGLVQGVLATQTQLLDVLKRHGVTSMDAQPGEPFDPNLHQAVSMVADPNQPANAIVQVLQQGFMIHDRVLRPAMVVVSSGA